MTHVTLGFYRSVHPKQSRRCVVCDAEFWFQGPMQKTCSKKCAGAKRAAYRAAWRSDPANHEKILEARRRWREKHRP